MFPPMLLDSTLEFKCQILKKTVNYWSGNIFVQYNGKRLVQRLDLTVGGGDTRLLNPHRQKD